MPRRPSDPGVPQTPADYYGAELRAYREAVELSRPQLAELLGYTPQWIGQVEQGTSAPSEDFAKDCDTFFKTNGTFYRLWKWNKLIGQLHILPPGFPDFLKRESEAVIIHIFENMVITGLLQTPEYAREVLKEGRTPDETEQLVSTRVERQSLLDGEDAPHIVAVFDEGAILRPVGDEEVMRRQISHLIELAERPNITLQIVPSTVGAYAGVMGAFMLLSFEDEPDAAYIEGHLGGQLLDRSRTVREYDRRFDLIRGVALSVDDSLKLLRAMLEKL
jgi:transcriptional regulator with XRE-family HTH domain